MKMKQPLKNAPLTAYEKARLVWFENYGSSIVQRSRYFTLLVLAAWVILMLGFALASLAPLKTVVPYVVKVTDKGSVTVDRTSAQPYTPGDAEKKYFFANWAIKMLTLDTYLTERFLTEAYPFTRGKGADEFRDWMDKTRPIVQVKEEKALTRTVKVNYVSFMEDKPVAFVHLTTETRRATGAAETEKLVVTIQYEVDPPKSEEDILKNPVGLYITHFEINKDLAQTL